MIFERHFPEFIVVPDGYYEIYQFKTKDNLDSEHQQYLETCLLNLQEIHDNKNIEDWPKLTEQLMCEIDHDNIPF